MNESYIDKKFKKICERHEMRVIKLSTQFEIGIPDRLILFKGFVGFCEIKAPGKKPKPHQQAYLNKLQMEGNFVGVVDSIDSIWTWVREFKCHIKQIS